MCGIVGYTGAVDAVGILLDGLERLEYRGYDSAGIGFFEDGGLKTVKCRGRLENLKKRLAAQPPRGVVCGIGHTRWATHGEPSDENSHPHSSRRVTVVHNGIIENYKELKSFLEDRGYLFSSETDTEAAAHLIDYFYAQSGDIKDAIGKAVSELTGSYALGILCVDDPGVIYAVRRDSPLVIGIGDGENYIASDMPAILTRTRNYYLLDPGEIASVRADGISVTDFGGNEVKKTLYTAAWDISAAEKGGYDHFMLKEIMETPRVLRDTLEPKIAHGIVSPDAVGLTDDELRSVKRVYIVGCGSAMHVGAAAKYVFEGLAKLPSEVDTASEFRYRDPLLCEGDLVLLISQSGETADTLAALRLAKSRGVRTLAIVNVVGSSIAREADGVVYTAAGPEIAVATTKAFSAQLATIYLLAVRAAYARGVIDEAKCRELTAELLKLPEESAELLENTDDVKKAATLAAGASDVFFIGRGQDTAAAMEGSLKLKEISYIHSEAYVAGELKHGPISLITADVPVVALLTQYGVASKMASNIKEVAARGAPVIAIGKREIISRLDGVFAVDAGGAAEMYSPLLCVLKLQLFAYYIAAAKGCDIDKPRNLAKSVTVE